jgi:hypothetical protein
VAAPEPATPRERCELHEDRPSVGRCQSCGRATCIGCAIPFRGRLLCESCASRELGVPEPPARPARRRRPDLAAAILFGVGLLLTVPPWHRSGPLTELFSAWRPGPQPWPLTASIGVLVALALSLSPLVTPALSLRGVRLAYGLVAAVAAVAAAVALAASPDYTSPTLAPFAVAAVAASGAVLGAVRARRPRP